jgi:hypothetical protein
VLVTLTVLICLCVDSSTDMFMCWWRRWYRIPVCLCCSWQCWYVNVLMTRADMFMCRRQCWYVYVSATVLIGFVLMTGWHVYVLTPTVDMFYVLMTRADAFICYVLMCLCVDGSVDRLSSDDMLTCLCINDSVDMFMCWWQKLIRLCVGDKSWYV